MISATCCLCSAYSVCVYDCASLLLTHAISACSYGETVEAAAAVADEAEDVVLLVFWAFSDAFDWPRATFEAFYSRQSNRQVLNEQTNKSAALHSTNH
jgi:hypothetical protein